MKPKKNGLSREQAAQLYDDLRNTMSALQKKHAQAIKPTPSQALKSYRSAKPAISTDQGVLETPEFASAPFSTRVSFGSEASRGSKAAFAVIVVFAFGKVVTSALEFSGAFSAASADATMIQQQQASNARLAGMYSREEVSVLTQLDARRVELEERNKRLDQREQDLNLRDREYVSRLTQLKELTDQVKVDRTKQEQRNDSQIDQLANVYGSMNPPEAAALIEQLDVTIALSLLERMPEKRIGQILALMNADRALTITRMLSGKAAN